jgi:hypothetical protein
MTLIVFIKRMFIRNNQPIVAKQGIKTITIYPNGDRSIKYDTNRTN